MTLHIAKEEIIYSSSVLFSKSSSLKKEQIEDDAYLLRLCHKYQWEQIQEFCVFLIQSVEALQKIKKMTKQRQQEQIQEQEQQEPSKKKNMAMTPMTTMTETKKTTKNSKNKNVLWDDENTVLNKLIYLIQAQLYKTDQWGNTSLHVICHHKPPNSIVSSILYLIDSCNNYHHKNRNDTSNILTMKNFHSATPLLVACTTGASCTVIQTLLSYITTTVTTTTNNVDTSIVQLPDTSGMTSILSLLLRYEFKFHYSSTSDDNSTSESSTTVISGLLYPNFFTENDDDVETIHSNNININNDDTNVVEALRGESNNKDNENNKNNKQDEILPKLKDLFVDHIRKDHAELLLDCIDELFQEAWRASSFNTVTTKDISLLHLVANVADSLPPTLTDLLIQKYYNSTTFISTNTSNNIPSPLHIAIGSACTSNAYYHNYPQLIYNRNYFIRHLLLLDPKSAAAPLQLLRDNNTTTPRTYLCHAIQAGWTWYISTDLILQQLDDDGVDEQEEDEDYEHYYFDEDDDDHHCQHNLSPIDDCSSRGVLQKLFKCEPDAITMKDPITSLYPFAIAATVVVAKPTRTKSSDIDANDWDISTSNHRDVLQLDTIYNLLRLHPQAIVS